MKIEIEVTEETAEELTRAAIYCQTDHVHAAEWFVQEWASYLRKCDDGGTVWLGLVNYLREIDISSPRLDLIERYIAACLNGYRYCKSHEECQMMDQHLKSLKSWLELVAEAE